MCWSGPCRGPLAKAGRASVSVPAQCVPSGCRRSHDEATDRLVPGGQRRSHWSGECSQPVATTTPVRRRRGASLRGPRHAYRRCVRLVTNPADSVPTMSPKASQSGFSHTKPGSRTFDVSAGRAVTPQEGQIGAPPTSLSTRSLMWAPSSQARRQCRDSILLSPGVNASQRGRRHTKRTPGHGRRAVVGRIPPADSSDVQRVGLVALPSTAARRLSRLGPGCRGGPPHAGWPAHSARPNGGVRRDDDRLVYDVGGTPPLSNA